MMMKKSGGDDGGGLLYTSLGVLCCVLVLSVIAVVSIRFSVSGSPFPSSVSSVNSAAITIAELQKKVIAATLANPNPSRAIASDLSYYRNSSFTPIPRKSTVVRKDDKIEEGLARARAAIRKAAVAGNLSMNPGGIYRNAGAFYQSYKEMERKLKVYVYEDGDFILVHNGPCKDIYASEGRFISEMEYGNNKFRTRDPHSAHLYFMPFSVAWMVKFLYVPLSYNLAPLKQYVSDYVRLISTKYPFWNRTHGADHFMLSCHDWAPVTSKGNDFLYNTSIRVLCNANSSEGFNPQKDVSLPEIYLYNGVVSPKLQSPPPANIPRPYLGFFAGGLHGHVRETLFDHWKEKDSQLRVYQQLPKDMDYPSEMLHSKFCLCPSGYEVASPRVVEAIYAECVPVMLSDHYVFPFSDVLNWEAFSLQVNISDIPRLKDILLAVPDDKYMKLKEGMRAVRKHFELNRPARRFDMFHMILHSIWLRRLNLRL
ncbi:probable glycosyltransferase At5g25310 [Solanum pennellii]|uniref:Probable glycosyltransferase At5g25310 n=1 Tax=Solanum pennellii TaxID=28526 RepID=A0ABM1HDU7_SOLPN|nr:probable glycosyltransferase At5g25310 [Solanum pennellii]